MSNDTNKEFMLFTLSWKCVGITIYILHYHDITEITKPPDKAGAHKDKMAPASKSEGMIHSLIYYVFKRALAPYNCINVFRKNDKKLFVIAHCVRAKKKKNRNCVPTWYHWTAFSNLLLAAKCPKKLSRPSCEKFQTAPYFSTAAKRISPIKKTKKKQTDVDVKECNVHPSFSWSILNDHQQIQSNVFNLRGWLSKLWLFQIQEWKMQIRPLI